MKTLKLTDQQLLMLQGILHTGAQQIQIGFAVGGETMPDQQKKEMHQLILDVLALKKVIDKAVEAQTPPADA
jgi:hypothetical protein